VRRSLERSRDGRALYRTGCPTLTPTALHHYQGLHWTRLRVRGRYRNRQCLQVWQLAWTLHNFHYRRGHRHDQLAGWRLAATAAHQLPDVGAQILSHRLLGRAYVVLGHHEEALAALGEALALSEQQDDPAVQAQTHYTLASIHPDGRRALEHARQALDLYRGLGQSIAEGNALNAVGWYAARVQEYDVGREHCRAALAIFERHQDIDGQAQTLDSLGYIEHHSGRHHGAIRTYRRAISLYRDLDNAYEAADTLARLGHPHLATGRRDQAEAVWREASELYRRQGRDEEAEEVERLLDALEDTRVRSAAAEPAEPS
jgi:tetratricopeptide (TPR) repeat protein